MSQMIVMCWPADEEIRSAWAERLKTPALPRYAGSVLGNCSRCGIAVLVAPRGQKVLQALDAAIACAVCAALLDPDALVFNLGNPDDLSRR